MAPKSDADFRGGEKNNSPKLGRATARPEEPPLRAVFTQEQTPAEHARTHAHQTRGQGLERQRDDKTPLKLNLFADTSKKEDE